MTGLSGSRTLRAIRLGLPPSLADEKACLLSRSSRPSRRCANDARRGTRPGSLLTPERLR
jgi:hypothetical protein